MIASCTFSTDKNSTKINLRGESRFIIEKKTRQFFLCPRLMSSSPQKLGSHVGYSKKNMHDWTLGVSDAVLEAYGRLFRDAVSPDFMFMVDNARLNRAHIVDNFQNIHRMN